jgi:hypothetical protein
LKSEAKKNNTPKESEHKEKFALNDAMLLWESSFSDGAHTGPPNLEPPPIKPFYETEGKTRGLRHHRQSAKKHLRS